MHHIIWRNKLDRQIVYPGAIPLETDLLNTNRFTMIAIAKLAASVMGSNTYLNGLTCTASSPASMVINIAPGEIYSLQNIDSTAYSSLPADTAHSILKQGILLSATSFTLAAPSTAGQSINYLIQVAFQDVDSGATVLPYYNASNPSQAYSGPNNSGIAQNTIRSGVCSVSVKTGVSATTGSQVTPSPDAGYVGAYVVTVNQGQTTITSTSINFAANAPFLPKNGLVSGIQSNTMNYSADTGTANNYVASYFPAVTQLTDGMRLTFKAKNSNTASSTFSPNGLASAPIYTRTAGALTGGEIAQNKIMEVEWNSTLSAWTLISGSDPLAIGALQKSANLSDLPSPQTALGSLGLTGIGIGLSTQPTIANFDFQTFAFTSGANYAVSSSTWLNVPVEVVYPTGIIISITVISVTGNTIVLKLVPGAISGGKFNTYYIRMSGTVGARIIYAIQDWNSASPIPINGGGTGATTAADALTNFGLNNIVRFGTFGTLPDGAMTTLPSGNFNIAPSGWCAAASATINAPYSPINGTVFTWGSTGASATGLLAPPTVGVAGQTWNQILFDEAQAIYTRQRIGTTAWTDWQQIAHPKYYFIYPDGTSASPYVYPVSTRKEYTNPFPGKYLNVVAEIQVTGIWASVPYVFAESSVQGIGIQATQINGNGNIVVQSGSNKLAFRSLYQGNPFGITADIGAAPFRLRISTVGDL